MKPNMFLQQQYDKQPSDKKKITNKHYRQFLDEGIIKTYEETDILEACAAIRSKYQMQARALLIALYWTGARPNELLQMRAEDIAKDGNRLIVKLQGSKGGLPRTIYLPMNKPTVAMLWDYAYRVFPHQFLFWAYKGKYVRRSVNKKGIVKMRTETSDKLRYHVKRWMSVLDKGVVPPYYLRHNRFSKLAAKDGITMQDLRMLKGSKSFESVIPYLHMSGETARKISNKMD